MSSAVPVTDAELMTVVASRQLRDGFTVFAGVGLPLLASVLARSSHAPRLQIVIEGGIVDPEMIPGRLPISTNEMRAAYRATALIGITDTFLLAQRGHLDVGFIGGGQVDRHGNVNSSVIGSHRAPTVRLPGSGGANDIISLCRETMIVTTHDRRRFVDAVDFVTSPGYLSGHRSRWESGLRTGRPSRVITNLGILGFNDDGLMRLDGVHPGVSVDDVRANTGFELLVSDTVSETAPVSAEELRMVRALDPERRFLR